MTETINKINHNMTNYNQMNNTRMNHIPNNNVSSHRSRSPVHYRSRSPVRYRTRSPVRYRSRSPVRSSEHVVQPIASSIASSITEPKSWVPQPHYTPQPYVQPPYVQPPYVQPPYVQPPYVQQPYDPHSPYYAPPQSGPAEAEKDQMGHILVCSYTVIRDFIVSIHRRKKRDFTYIKLRETLRNLQQTLAINNNQPINIPIPNTFHYDMTVSHISVTLDAFHHRIYWCSLRHKYCNTEGREYDEKDDVIKMINDIRKLTGDIVCSLERHWSERCRSWFIQILLNSTFTQQQKIIFENLVKQTRDNILTN